MIKAETTKQLATRWGVTRSRVAQIIRDGGLPGAEKFGRDWVVYGYPDLPNVKAVLYLKRLNLLPATIGE